MFLYQGDEIGLLDGPDGDPPDDRFGRDRHRHPMQWDAGPQGGFTTGAPWLPPVDPAVRNVAGQRADPASLWSLHHDLIALRRELGGGLELVAAAEEGGLLAYRRGDVLVALNLGAATLPLPAGEPLLRTPSRGRARAGRRRDRARGLSTLSGMPWDTGMPRLDAETDFQRARRRQVLYLPRPAAARRAGRHQRDPAVRRGGARSRPHRRARDRPRDDPACEHRWERRSHARLRPPLPADLEPPARALAGHQPGPAARARRAPISVYRIGDLHFVRDGHHRVSVALSLHHSAIEASVTVVETLLSADGISRRGDLVVKDYERLFRQRVPLPAEMAARIRVADPWDYAQLSESVEAWSFGSCRATAASSTAATQRGAGSRRSTCPSSGCPRRRPRRDGGDLRVACDRYRLIRTHEWSDEIVARLRPGRRQARLGRRGGRRLLLRAVKRQVRAALRVEDVQLLQVDPDLELLVLRRLAGRVEPRRHLHALLAAAQVTVPASAASSSRCSAVARSLWTVK